MPLPASVALKAGMICRVHRAVDGRTLDHLNHPIYARTRRLAQYGKDLNAGEIGCLLSHRAVYETMVREGIETALVLEDDVRLFPDFPETLRQLMTLDLPWDMIRFLGSAKIAKRRDRVVRRVGPYNLKRLSCAPGGAHATLLTRRAALILLEHLQRTWLPIDILHGHTWRTGLDVFALSPAPISNDDGTSTIDSDRFAKTLDATGWRRRLLPLTRAWYKAGDNVGRYWAYVSSWPADARRRP